MSLNKQVAESVKQELIQVWGGRMPTWEEFKHANRSGRVRANKTIAAEAVSLGTAPRSYTVLYGIVVIGAALLIVPAAIVAYFLSLIGGWWILGSVVAAAYLFVVARDGACEGMKAGAVESEAVYQRLVNSGAFLFKPD